MKLFKSFLIISVLIIQPVMAQEFLSESSAISLDRLLNGLDNQCEYSDDLRQLQRTLLIDQGGSYRFNARAKDRIQANLKPAIGNIRLIEDDDEYAVISISVNGTWHGFSVSDLQFVLGKENGINATSVIFNPPFDPVLSFFSPRIKASKQAILSNANDYMEIVTDLNVVDGKIRLDCDVST
ncbi:hypothetical protein [Allochromatium palmeri]|uniref:Uncharacterized protein n=1 Tax=Allochromatium palmeri TaxID=231048 RepID=A0A6N8EGD7_9GAMM|nr:hypothetical protein [Allochromatium palmeri]MTW22610.1 hypothetical protein [Allochromatium palmeri]